MSIFVMSNGVAGDLAPHGTRPYTGTVVIHLGSRLYLEDGLLAVRAW